MSLTLLLNQGPPLPMWGTPMIGLTTPNLTAMRADAGWMLTHVGTVRRRPSPGAAYETVTDALACLLQLSTGREDDRLSDVAAEVDANCLLLAHVGSNLARLDHVTVDGRVIELRYADPRPVAVARWLGRVEA